MKDEIEDFDELKEADLGPMRETIADKVLISAVKTLAELFREQDLQAYSRHPKILPKFGKTTKLRYHLEFTLDIQLKDRLALK